MDLKASSLARLQDSHTPRFQSVAKAHLKTIQQKIKEAHKNMQDSITYDLPIVFSSGICNIPIAIVQKIVYYMIISELDDKGFQVELDKDDPDHPYLIIKWVSLYGEEKQDKIDLYLAKFTKKN